MTVAEVPNNLAQSSEKAKELKLSLTKVEETYDTYFKTISQLEKDDIIVKQNCKFCTHPGRSEAETKWEKTGSYTVVQKYFDTYRKDDPSSPKMHFQNVKNHLLNHYEQQQKKVWLREYGDRLLAVMNKKVNDEYRLQMLTQQMEMLLHDVVADPRLDPHKRIDSAVKLGKMIIDLELTQAKLRGELQTVNIVTEKFTNIWFRAITAQRDPLVKRALMESLDTFQESLEGVPIYESD